MEETSKISKGIVHHFSLIRISTWSGKSGNLLGGQGKSGNLLGGQGKSGKLEISWKKSGKKIFIHAIL